MKTHLIGHEHQRHALSQLVRRERVPQAMMFCGPSGIGKYLVARELAFTLLCSARKYGGCGACKSCHLIEAGNHPDLYALSCVDKENTGVQEVREVLCSIALNPYESHSRVVLFNDAEYLSTQSVNTLLKALEEPRPETYFLLITASPSKLPQTVASRCQVWFFNSLQSSEIAAILSHRLSLGHALPDGVSAAQLARMADGSMDAIDAVADHIDEWRLICSGLEQVASGQCSQAAVLAQELSKHKQHIRMALQLLRIRARECMRMPEWRPMLSRWAIFLSNVVTAERLILERNLSPVLVLTNAILSLYEGADGTWLDIVHDGRGLLEGMVVS